MSDPKKNKGFEASVWRTAGAAGGGAGSTGASGNEEGFRNLYAGSERDTAGGSFVASFISEEKARSLARSDAPDTAPHPTQQEALEALEQQAYEKGFSKGQAEGLAEGRARSQEMIERLQRMLSDVESAWGRLIQTHESRIIELVYRAAEKVVYGLADLDREMVKRAIINALAVIPEPMDVQITVHPKDYEYIETIKEDFFSHIKTLKDVSVTPDPAVRQGGCTVRTKFGEVDATLESRLEAIRECLTTANGKKASSL